MIRSHYYWRRILLTRHACASNKTSPEMTTMTMTRTPTTTRLGFRRLAMNNYSTAMANTTAWSSRRQNKQNYHNNHYSISENTNQGQSKSMNNIQIRTVFIQTENTPNPESIKFVPTNTVSGSR